MCLEVRLVVECDRRPTALIDRIIMLPGATDQSSQRNDVPRISFRDELALRSSRPRACVHMKAELSGHRHRSRRTVGTHPNSADHQHPSVSSPLKSGYRRCQVIHDSLSEYWMAGELRRKTPTLRLQMRVRDELKRARQTAALSFFAAGLSKEPTPESELKLNRRGDHQRRNHAKKLDELPQVRKSARQTSETAKVARHFQ